jgi:hypothetical protein
VIKVKPNCNNITIRYNEIYNSARAEIENTNGETHGEGIDNVNGNNMIVQNNYFHDLWSEAVYAKGGAADALIENNLIERCLGAGLMIGFDTSPEFFDTNVNPQYYENIRGVVRNNLIIDTGWEGIGLYASKDAQVYNNTLVNVAKNSTIPHSSLYFGLTYQDWEPHPGRPANVNPNIHHNIICQLPASIHHMIDIRYANNLGGMSALDGNPTMNNNCYYIAGKSAGFRDNRPGSIFNGGLAAWKSHINGDDGSIEADPALGADYMPANAQCTEMGILYPLIINPPIGIDTQLPLPEVVAYISNGILYIESPVAETVQAYSTMGALLFNFQKPEGKVSYIINPPKNAIIIIRGNSGWAKKIFVK